MCGIAGIVNLKDYARVSSDVLNSMLSIISYRGPDDHGVYRDEYVDLGHTRLSIIDLAAGHQPMCNEKENIWITFNGEIFNYIELKQELLKKGHRFKTESDTEVIIHLYEEHGVGCL
ncbi:MAG: asparagine synthetase B, partial [Deltaproteobacteria bacterium]|nr:asparagine synthetase B [Deltaproteobacteria bacterium]